jgi:hypothetical protein
LTPVCIPFLVPSIFCLLLPCFLKMEAVYSTEALVNFFQITQHHIPEDCTCHSHCHYRSLDSSVSIATGYGLDIWGSIPARGKKFVSTPQNPELLWGPPSLLSNVFQRYFL